MRLCTEVESVLRPRGYSDIFDILAGQRRGRRRCRHVETPVKLLHNVRPPRTDCHSKGFHPGNSLRAVVLYMFEIKIPLAEREAAKQRGVYEEVVTPVRAKLVE